MHKIAIPSYAIERALARRGRLHPFEDLSLIRDHWPAVPRAGGSARAAALPLG